MLVYVYVYVKFNAVGQAQMLLETNAMLSVLVYVYVHVRCKA